MNRMMNETDPHVAKMTALEELDQIDGLAA